METIHLKIGVVQIDSEVAKASANLEHAAELVNVAARQGAQIV